MLPGQASLLCIELWIHVALTEFQPKAPLHPHPALQRCLCHGKLWICLQSQLTVQVLCTQLGGSLGFAHAATEKGRRCKSTISSQIFLTSVFTQQLCSAQRDQPFPSLHSISLWAVPAAAVQPYPLSTPQAHVTEPSGGNRTRSSPARPVPTRVTFTVSPGRTALRRGWVKDSSSQCAVSGSYRETPSMLSLSPPEPEAVQEPR